MPRLTAAILKYSAKRQKIFKYLSISHAYSWVVYIETKENFGFGSAAYHSSFLPEFCILWNAKYPRVKINTFGKYIPAVGWPMLRLAYLALFDSLSGRRFVCFPKSVIPQFLAPEFVNCYFKWTLRKCLLLVFTFGFAWFLMFCNDNYHSWRSNLESVDWLGSIYENYADCS